MADVTGGNKPRRRRIAWLVVSAAVVVAGAAVSFGVHLWHQNSAPFRAGTCFQVVDDTGIVATDGLREVSGRVKTVDCGTGHNAETTRTARHVADCAAEGAWLKSVGEIYCVTFTRTSDT
jgi:hypothetical protein